VSVNQVERAPLILPQVDKFAPGDVDWWIISDETAEERFVEMQEAGYDPVIFGLTDEGYKNLSLNVKNIMKLIQQQQAVIDAYEEYYKKESKDGTDNTGTTE
jgi:chaperone required for assembly of F1-ATPase